MTRNSEVVGSTSDEATGVLTWLLRTCPTAHSDCSKLGDEKYVTGKCPSWRIITIGPWTKRAAPRAPRRSRVRDGETVARPPLLALRFAHSVLARGRATHTRVLRSSATLNVMPRNMATQRLGERETETVRIRVNSGWSTRGGSCDFAPFRPDPDIRHLGKGYHHELRASIS